MKGNDSQLPPGWSMKTLGQIGRYHNGRGFKKHEWGKTGLQIVRIQDLTGSRSNPNFYCGELEGRHRIRNGDLLLSWAATLDAFVWRGADAALNQHIFKVESSVDRRFHYYLLKHVLADLYRSAHGTGMVHVTKGKFEATPVPIPPPDEQRRLAEALDSYFSRLDDVEAGLERVQRNLKRYRASVLQAAVTGAVTADDVRQREEEASSGRSPSGIKASDFALPAGWQWAALGDLLRSIEAGRSFRCAERPPTPGEVGIVKVSAVSWGSFREEESKTVLQADRIVPDYFIQPGDFLVSRANTIGLVGACVVVKGIRSRLMLSDKVLRLQFKADYSDWVLAVLRSAWGRSEIERLATGNQDSMRNIGQDRLRQIRVPLPPDETRRALVGELETCLASGERIGAGVESARLRISRLRRRILAAAFEGRLSGDAFGEVGGNLK